MENLKKIPKHMLVVDDEKSMRDLLTEYLNEHGYEVTCAVNGQDALQCFSIWRHGDRKYFTSNGRMWILSITGSASGQRKGWEGTKNLIGSQ